LFGALQRHQGGHLDEIGGGAAAREIGHGSCQALQERTKGRGTGQALDELVGDVAQRRKTLRNALSEVCTADTLHQAGISPSARAETIAVEDFITLANLLPEDEARAVET
jgi:hypothetical protein